MTQADSMSTARAPEAASVARSFAGTDVAGRGHERPGADPEAGAAELGGQERRRRQAAATSGDSVLRSSLAMTRSPGRSSGARPPATPTSATAVCSSRLRRELAPARRARSRPGADDDVGAADGERLDAKRRENLELSRRTLRSRSARGP